MTIRALLGVVLVASVLSAAPPALSAAPVLGVHNTVKASEDGSVDVTLPRDVTLSLEMNTRSEPGPAPWITFKGGGRTAGVVLVPKGASDYTRGLVAFRFRACRDNCRERPVNHLMINTESFRGTQTLPSGEYTLYVFTDGKPTTIQLHLEGLAGGAEIHVVKREHADVHTPVTQVERREDVTVFSAGASYRMETHKGLFMAVNVMRGPRYQDASFDECLSSDRAVPDELEATYCLGGFRFIRPIDPTKLHPKRGGFILISVFGLHDYNDNAFNGDSHLQHYNFRVISPGRIGELWSQGLVLSL